MQIVGLFAVIAAVPTILVAVVASATLDRGLDRFFSTRTRAMIEHSLIVADAYVRDHAEAIRGDILAMAYDLGRAKPMFDQDRDQFRQFLTAQATGARAGRRHHHQAGRLDGRARRRHHGPDRSCCRRRNSLSEITDTDPQVALIPDGDHVAAVVKLHGYDDIIFT